MNFFLAAVPSFVSFQGEESLGITVLRKVEEIRRINSKSGLLTLTVAVTCNPRLFDEVETAVRGMVGCQAASRCYVDCPELSARKEY